MREEQGRDDVAVIRMEQLYPFPYEELTRELSKYPAQTPVVWVQEEPRNMGPWYFVFTRWAEFELDRQWPLAVVSRPESASPSTGSKKTHKIEQQEIISAALGDGVPSVAK